MKAGPFTYPNFRLALGPTRDTSIRNIQCLTRDFLDILAYINLNTDAVSEVANQTTYGMMARRMEAEQNFDRTNIHGGGHFAVGGFIGTFGKDPYNSPGGTCPLPYLPPDYPKLNLLFRPSLLPPPRNPRLHLVEMANPKSQTYEGYQWTHRSI